MPKISVIVPVYNSERYLSRCLNSLLSGREQDLEILLIDDGSTDRSGLLCDEYAASDPRVRVIHQENGGVSAARNRGIREAVGEYLSFVDSDDHVDPGFYRRLLDGAERGCDVVMCDAVKESGRQEALFTQDIRPGFYDRAALTAEYFPKLIMQNTLTYPPATSNWLLLIRRELILKHRLSYPLGIRISEDLYFGAAVMYHAQSFTYLKGEALYRYEAGNADSASKKADPALWPGYERLLTLLWETFGGAEEYDFSTQLSHAALFFALHTIGQTAAYPLTAAEKHRITDRVVTSRFLREAMSSVSSLAVPTKLLWQTKLLGSRPTARLLTDYLILRSKRKKGRQP